MAVTQGTGIQRSHPAHGGRPGAARFNQIVSFGDMLYLAGQVAADTKAPGMDTYYGQTKQVLGQVEQLLKQAGSSMDHLLQVRALAVSWILCTHEGADLGSCLHMLAPCYCLLCAPFCALLKYSVSGYELKLPMRE